MFKIELNSTMKYISTLLFFIFFVNLSGYSQQGIENQMIKDANKAYTEGKFNEAAELYEKVLSKGFSAPELNYNLGNAYYRLGDYKRAILNYERARLLNPENENIAVNLEFCQKFVQDKIEIVPKFFLIRWIQSFIDLFKVDTWAVISIISFVSLLGLILLFLFTKSLLFRKLSLYLGFLLIFISFISIYSAYKQNLKLTNHKSAIVFSPSVTVKSSPNESGTDLFIIHEGLKVTLTDKSGNWMEIRLSDGKIGWLPAETIEEI